MGASWNMRIVPLWPIRCSVTARMRESSSENATRLTAVGNSHECRHSPVRTDHNRSVLSAEPVTSSVDVAATAQRALQAGSSAQSASTVHTVPLCPA